MRSIDNAKLSPIITGNRYNRKKETYTCVNRGTYSQLDGSYISLVDDSDFCCESCLLADWIGHGDQQQAPRTLFHKFVHTTAELTIVEDTIGRRANNPFLVQHGFAVQTCRIPGHGNRVLRLAFGDKGKHNVTSTTAVGIQAGILRLRSATYCQLLHYPRVSVHSDRLTAPFVNTVKRVPGVRTLGDGRDGYGLTLTVGPGGAKHWYQHLYIYRDTTKPARRLVLGVFKVANESASTPFPAPSATQYAHRV